MRHQSHRYPRVLTINPLPCLLLFIIRQVLLPGPTHVDGPEPELPGRGEIGQARRDEGALAGLKVPAGRGLEVGGRGRPVGAELPRGDGAPEVAPARRDPQVVDQLRVPAHCRQAKVLIQHCQAAGRVRLRAQTAPGYAHISELRFCELAPEAPGLEEQDERLVVVGVDGIRLVLQLHVRPKRLDEPLVAVGPLLGKFEHVLVSHKRLGPGAGKCPLRHLVVELIVYGLYPFDHGAKEVKEEHLRLAECWWNAVADPRVLLVLHDDDHDSSLVLFSRDILIERSIIQQHENSMDSILLAHMNVMCPTMSVRDMQHPPTQTK